MAQPNQEDGMQMVEHSENFKKLVNLIDRLRDIGLNDLISMPRIAVCGSQSSGKSSLLEAIVGINFLPRGSGVVTRRPLELRLVKNKNQSDQPYGLFKQDGDKKYTDFNKIRERIEQLTDEVCGTSKNIIDDPIILNVISPNCPDLTVIDLPGITRIPIGNQPKNIEQITKDLVTRYCKDERTIILAVIPANADMTTSEALQLAQQLDVEGKRTIGVITKIDIMDKGTDARQMLLNKEVPLRMGYIGVKGRSQEDIQNKIAVNLALRQEQDFFMNHNAYRHLPKEILGTPALIFKLTTVMYDHMKNVLPSILKEINHKLKNCESNLAKLGEPVPEDNKEKLDGLWRDISIFYDKFKANIKGEYNENYSKYEKEKLKVLASAQIIILFNNLYKNYLNNFRASTQYKDSEIDKIVGLYTGNTLPGFLSVDCFIALTSPLLEKLRLPALELLEKIYLILKTVGSQILNETFQKSVTIREILTKLFNEELEVSKDKAEDMINKFLDCETRVIYTKDPAYIINANSWPDDPNRRTQLQQTQQLNQQNPMGQTQNINQQIGQQNQGQISSSQQKQQPPQQQQVVQVQQTQRPQTSLQNPNQQQPIQQQQQGKQEVQQEGAQGPEEQGKQKLNKKERKDFLVKEMRKRIDQYFEINAKQVGDMIPKLITNFLINDVLDKIYFMMFKKVSDNQILDMIKEPDHIIQQRKILRNTLEILNNSKKVLLKDSDLKIGFLDTTEEVNVE